jgi:hypothetical protein
MSIRLRACDGDVVPVSSAATFVPLSANREFLQTAVRSSLGDAPVEASSRRDDGPHRRGMTALSVAHVWSYPEDNATDRSTQPAHRRVARDAK